LHKFNSIYMKILYKIFIVIDSSQFFLIYIKFLYKILLIIKRAKSAQSLISEVTSSLTVKVIGH
jgi:hypothetical protein